MFLGSNFIQLSLNYLCLPTDEHEKSSHSQSNFKEDGFFYSFSALDDPYIPTTPIELALVVLLAIPSAIFISYSLIVVYRCVCTRNYAEWRSSWGWGPDSGHDYYTQVNSVLELSQGQIKTLLGCS